MRLRPLGTVPTVMSVVRGDRWQKTALENIFWRKFGGSEAGGEMVGLFNYCILKWADLRNLFI